MDWVVPRFTTEDVAGIVDVEHGDIVPVLPMSEWIPAIDGEPDYVVSMRGFSFFGKSYCNRPVGDTLTYQEWKSRKEADDDAS
jgi:hypothetical protein